MTPDMPYEQLNERLSHVSGEVEAAYQAIVLPSGGESDETLRQAVDTFRAWLVPPWCEGIREDFWGTREGRALSATEWYLNEDDAITLAEAARRLGMKADANGQMRVRDMLTLYHYPGVSRSANWYVLAQDAQQVGRQQGTEYIDAMDEANK